MAGNLKMADYLKTWKEGRDNFGADPPNATLSVYEPGRAEQTFVVVTISKPVVDGADLLYTYKIIEGTMPKNGGATSLFIDWFGVGAGSERASTASAWDSAAPVLAVGAGLRVARFSDRASALAVPESPALTGSGGDEGRGSRGKSGYQ